MPSDPQTAGGLPEALVSQAAPCRILPEHPMMLEAAREIEHLLVVVRAAHDAGAIEYQNGYHDGYEAGCDVAATTAMVAFIKRIADTPLMHFDTEAVKREAVRLVGEFVSHDQ